jgi:excisionase family DNA binding protein
MMTVDGVEMVDVHEAAVLVGRTPETIRRWVWAGRLRSVKHGNKHLIPRDQLVGARAGENVVADAPTVTLADWVAEATAAMTRPSGGTAADLVIEDRRARAGR